MIAREMHAYRGKSYIGAAVMVAVACAIGISEVNAVMGKFVVCLTAGPCGIVPVALYAVEHYHLTDEQIVRGLFTAASSGMVIDQNTSVAGAAGCC